MRAVLWAVVTGWVVCGCSGSSAPEAANRSDAGAGGSHIGEPTETGGAAATGGVSGSTGGAVTSSGGVEQSGGATSAGGALSTGGASTGGRSSTGGTVAAGGAAAGGSVDAGDPDGASDAGSTEGGTGGEPTPDAGPCVCSDGPCCDGCHLRPTSHQCAGDNIGVAFVTTCNARSVSSVCLGRPNALDIEYWNVWCSGESPACEGRKSHLPTKTLFDAPCPSDMVCVAHGTASACEPCPI